MSEDRASTRGAPPRVDRRYRAAAVLLLVQGVVMEGFAIVGLAVLLALGVGQDAVGQRVEIFALPFLQHNLFLMMAMSGIFGALRTIGAIGLWRGRVWGFALSLVMVASTIVLMIFMLPAGIADGLLSGGALVLMLWARYGDERL